MNYRTAPLAATRANHQRLLSGLLGLAVALIATSAHGTQELLQPTSGPVFQMLGTYANGKVKLVGGQEVSPKDWPTLMVAKLGEVTAPNGQKSDITCTASLVGEGVILTAAHCLDAKEVNQGNRQRNAKLKLNNGQHITFTCLLPKTFASLDWAGPRTPRGRDDWAFCRFNLPPNVPAELKGLRYEVLDQREVAAADAVLMMGFGCKELFIGANGLDGVASDQVFTIGDHAVAAVGAEADGLIQTRAPWGDKPALCPGDSGGPLMVGATVSMQTEKRRVVGINSKVVALPSSSNDYDVISNIAPLSSPNFTAYLAEWLAQNASLRICGAQLAAGAYPCRK